MFDIFAKILKVINRKRSICIDNNVFTLHYRLTVILLIAFCLIISSRKYFGDPIDCTSLNVDRNIVDSYCWFNSYIVVPRNPDNADEPHVDKVHPVINSGDKFHVDKLKNPDSEYKAYYLHAYQWIEFIMFCQALLFFLPRYIWRYNLEQGRVKTLTNGLELVALKPDGKHSKTSDIAEYFKRNKSSHSAYAWKYIGCEILNFANVLAQYTILQTTFSLDWKTLWNDFFSSDSNINPHSKLNLVYPNVAKCDVPTAGGSGHMFVPQFCVLPVNVFVTKIYIFLWFYFYGLTVVSGLVLVYRLLTRLSWRLRIYLLTDSGKGFSDDCLRNLSYGDWFILRLVGKNVDSCYFHEIVREFCLDDTHTPKSTCALIENDKRAGSINQIYPVDQLHIERENLKKVQVTISPPDTTS